MQTSDFVNIAEKIKQQGSKLIIDSNKDLVIETLKI